MPREKKYGEKTIMFTKRIPESQKKSISDLVDSHLSDLLIEEKNTDNNIKTPPDELNWVVYSCGCQCKKGLLKKPKNSKCKLSKDEHTK